MCARHGIFGWVSAGLGWWPKSRHLLRLFFPCTNVYSYRRVMAGRPRYIFSPPWYYTQQCSAAVLPLQLYNISDTDDRSICDKRRRPISIGRPPITLICTTREWYSCSNLIAGRALSRTGQQSMFGINGRSWGLEKKKVYICQPGGSNHSEGKDSELWRTPFFFLLYMWQDGFGFKGSLVY